MPLAPADQIPDGVGEERADERRAEDGGEVHTAARRQGAGDDQRRQSRDRRAELLQEDVDEDEHQAVLGELEKELLHTRGIVARSHRSAVSSRS